jgi:hypothetical protein
MKAKSGYKVRATAGTNILVPENEETNFSNVISFNDTAAFIWENLQAECTVDELHAKLSAEFNAPADVLKADLVEFLDALDKNGLLEE